MWELFRTIVTRQQILICTLLLLTIAGACKKDIKIDVEPPPEPVVSERTEAQKLRDSVYYYYKLYSLWTEDLPVFDPISSYTDNFTSPNLVLSNLMGRTQFFPAYNGPIDRFSNIEPLSAGSSGSARADTEDGYGIYVSLVGAESVIYCYVNFVEGNSPGALAGIRRGDEVVSINGQILSGMTESALKQLLNSALNRNTLQIEIQRSGEPDTETHSLTYTSYSINPITKDTIFDVSGEKIGYLALSSFEELYNHGTSVSSTFRNELIRIFNDFDQENVSDLILDLRYNIGGYVSAAVFLANKVINQTGDNKLMFKYGLNASLRRSNNSRNGEFSGQFNDVYFSKSSANDIQNVYFLVTENTASAAEIVISVMLPYFPNAQIIAESTHTYGKPVGFFRQDIMGKIGLWATSFKVINADGYTDYYEGIPATKTGVKDDVMVDFGDPTETMIAQAISHSTTGDFLSGVGSGGSGPSLRTTRQAVPNAVKLTDVNHREPRHLLKD